MQEHLGVNGLVILAYKREGIIWQRESSAPSAAAWALGAGFTFTTVQQETVPGHAAVLFPLLALHPWALTAPGT